MSHSFNLHPLSWVTSVALVPVQVTCGEIADKTSYGDSE
jgi:hypothetical protein